VLRASRQALLPVPAATEIKAGGRRRPGRYAPALAAGLLLTGAVVAFAAAKPPDDAARGVVAAVTGASAASSPDEARRVLLAIAIANPGTESVRVAGYAPTTKSSAATQFDRPTAHVGAGEMVEITVDVQLRCGSPAPPVLPRLVIAEEDGGRRSVTVVGAVAALTELCAEGPAPGHPLTVTGTRREGADLVVDVAAPSNRRTSIQGVRATGVVLDAAALPLRVDRHPTSLRLRPPPACPNAWREDGIPTRLDVEVDTSGPGSVRLVVGTPLARWALDVVCGPS
jgi:hypothetical protein